MNLFPVIIFRLLVSIFVFALPVAAGIPELVKDMVPGTGPGTRDLLNFRAVGSTLFFTARTQTRGNELWKSDGTAAGTKLVKDIFVGGGSSDPASLVAMGGSLYFIATDGIHGRELWKSDGTEAGTVLLRDITAGPRDSDVAELTEFAGKLYFRAIDRRQRYYSELWETDGTPEGTVSTANSVFSGPSWLAPRYPASFVVVGQTMFFRAHNDACGIELWKTDGTADGTKMVKDIYAGQRDGNPSNLTSAGSTLYFCAGDSVHGTELWKSDGTAEGTVLVKDAVPGLNENQVPISSYPSRLTAVGKTLFFCAQGTTRGFDLWKSDGTSAGTVRVRKKRPGFPDGMEDLTALGGNLYFAGYSAAKIQLWKSSGTDAGTAVLFPDINYGYPQADYSLELTPIGKTLYFVGKDRGHGSELWKSNGKKKGTVMVKDIRPGADSSNFGNFLAVGKLLYFSASRDGIGYQLWKSDGTTAGTVMVSELETEGNSDSIYLLPTVGQDLYFTKGHQTKQLWKTRGAASNTVAIKQFSFELETRSPVPAAEMGGALYFRSFDTATGAELWKTSGTPANTVMVKDISEGSEDGRINSGDPVNLTTVGGTVYFAAKLPKTGIELWKSNGTAAGTLLVKDIKTGIDSSDPGNLTDMNGTLYFTAADATGDRELWKSDGTSAGTVRVKDIYPSASPFFSRSSNPSNLTVIGDRLYFTATDDDHGTELWKSDGTDEGTVLVKNIGSGWYSSNPSGLTVVGTTLYFSASDGTNGVELWKSDGTEEGTVMVKDIKDASYYDSSYPQNMAELGGFLYFTADSGTENNGDELWKSDGTQKGTVMVKNIAPGDFSADITHLTACGGRLYFGANDGIHGHELWESDGTPDGTRMVVDLTKDSGSSFPYRFKVVGTKLYFIAVTARSGWELYVYEPPATPPVMAATRIGNPAEGNSLDLGSAGPFGKNAGASRLLLLPSGGMKISFQVLPDSVYPIQRSSDLVNWTTIATPTSGPTGLLEFIDEDPPVPQAFYRLREP